MKRKQRMSNVGSEREEVGRNYGSYHPARCQWFNYCDKASVTLITSTENVTNDVLNDESKVAALLCEILHQLKQCRISSDLLLQS